MCGGWAIDLFLGEVTREHEDLEVAVFREHQRDLRRHYREWGHYKSISGWRPWEEEEFLRLPVHQVLFRAPGTGPPPDEWEPVDSERQFFLDDREDSTWICRRDPSIRRALAEVTTRSARGIPIVAPEVQLLYKAKHHLEKDEHDFRLTLPRLDAARRGWLEQALAVVHPGDPWLEALA